MNYAAQEQKQTKDFLEKHEAKSYETHCLKITKNVSFELFDFCSIKIDLSGNT